VGKVSTLPSRGGSEGVDVLADDVPCASLSSAAISLTGRSALPVPVDGEDGAVDPGLGESLLEDDTDPEAGVLDDEGEGLWHAAGPAGQMDESMKLSRSRRRYRRGAPSGW